MCEPHAAEADIRYAAAHPDRRPGSAERGYGSDWRTTRAAYLKAHPVCQDESGCQEKSTDVDHILPRAQGGTDAPSNLEALCHSHHSQKTAMFDGGFGNPVRGGAGGRR